ncbi:MAG TPA: C69 family dipeptidase [Atribacterota bacterium]|nr:C69 family dipeptidase [Atribacterota bacterium]HPK87100.1 C69 family dipeptidase [Atribacterota bacterium]
MSSGWGAVQIVFLGSVIGIACTSVPVGKDASVDGSVMTTHTCDGWYDARLVVVPGQTFEAGAMMPIYKNICIQSRPNVELKKVGEIPQVEKTYTYYHVGYPCMNENQVIIGETTFGGRREFGNGDAWIEIDQLEILGLQRSKTARECIEIMGALAEKYGYGDGGECLTVTDPNEAWHFEIMGPGPLWAPNSGKPGAVWVAQRIPDGEVGVSANRARIGEINLDDKKNFMASSNIFTLGEEMGFYDSKSGKPFNFYEVYAPVEIGGPYYSSRREWRVLSLVAPSLNLDPYAERFPFTVKPDKKLSVQDLMDIKRDHYEGTEFDLTTGMAAGPFGTPDRFATPGAVKPEDRKNVDWERAISLFRCSYSFISQARSWLPNPIGGLIWFGEDVPHSTCFVPFYCQVTEVPVSFSVGRRDIFDRNFAWWPFNFVSNWADLKYSYMIEDIKATQHEVEGDFLAMQAAVEMAALELYKKDPDLAVKYLTNYSNSCANRAVERWWKLADDLIAKYDDGYVDALTSVGYPTWWLEEVGYGDTTIKGYN